MKTLGALLILAGIAALAYGGFSYTTHRRAVDMGPVQIETSKQQLRIHSSAAGRLGNPRGRGTAVRFEFEGPLTTGH